MKKHEVKYDANGKRKFGMLDNVAYGAGDFGCNMSFALKGTMAIFWTQYMQMDSYLYAALLLVCQIWDAINDPLIGTMVDADQRKYKRNKFLQYIWVGSIGLIVAGALCFVPAPNAPKAAKAIIFVAGYVLWDAFYTIANVPYGSLLALISDDPGDRASLSAWRSVGALIGNMVTMILIPILIYDENNNIIGTRVFLIALIMGVLAFFAFQFMIKNTVIRVDTDVKTTEKKAKFNVWKAMGNFFRNRAALGATLAAMGMFLGMGGVTTAVTVMFQSYFHNAQISGVVSMFAMLPVLVFTWFARKMVNKYGKKELAVVGCIFQLAACVLMLILPITADTKGLMIYVICQLVNSLGLGIYSTVSWGMMGDAIDYNEWKFGAREEGTVYSLHSFFRKLAQGIGPSLMLVIMKGLGYVEADKGNQAADVALRMRYLVPAAYLFSAAMVFVSLAFIYNLDKKTLKKVEDDLEVRHAQALQAAEASGTAQAPSNE